MVALNEVLDLANVSKYEYLFLFKMDFEKAYDFVSSSFLMYMLRRFDFHGQ